MTITAVRDALQKGDPHELFKLHHAWVSTLIPFWRQAVIRIAELTGTPTDRRDKHLRAIEQSMTLLSGWRSKQITYVKARHREIDSAISFIRNAALTKPVSKYAFAPVCRNLAGILRGALYIHLRLQRQTAIIRKTKRAAHRKRSVHLRTPLRRNEALHFRGTY